jgi:outer membrane lipoprotein-sorting protein
VKRFFWLLFIPLFFLVSSVCAQNQSSIEAYQQFLNHYRRYQGLIEPFKTKKSRHLAFQSVSTQAELLGATKNLVLAEIEALTAYTSFIRSLLAEATQILEYRENVLYVKLDDELTFLKQAKEKAQTLSSLNEAEELLTDIANHHKKISQMSYQIKSIIEVESAKKIYGNLKVEKEKIAGFMAEERTDQAKILAAKEKFNELDSDLEAAGSLINTASLAQKNYEGNDPVKVSRQIRETLNQTLVKLNKVIVGYKNIVFSLK